MSEPAAPPPTGHNPDLLAAIPLSARCVLEIGCGHGALGLAYRARNPRVRYLGVDVDAAQAAIAATRLNEVAVADIEANPFPFGRDLRPDCIVYGDVLEHLRDPFALLARHLEILAPDGIIALSVPNLEHWSIAARLLAGTWDYEEEGLLDRTHLRWFTRTNLEAGLRRLGLAIHRCEPRIFDAPAADHFTETIAPALNALGVDASAYRERAQALQYVVRAGREARAPMILAASMLDPIGGVSHVRILYPMAALGSDPATRVQVYANGDAIDPPDPETPHIFILHRASMLGREGRTMLRSLLAQGWVIVTDFDDHPDYFEAMRRPGQLGFLGVHAVQTTTPALAEILARRNPEVAVFANAVPSLRGVHNFAAPDRLTLFFGALNREEDWRPLLGALNAAAKIAGARLHFRIVHDQALFDALETPHKDFTPVCDHETYLTLLGGCEISLMPLADTPFNRAKSDLKFLEASACRVMSLASRMVYGGSIADGRTGLLFDSAEALRERLLRLVAMPELARQIADAARAHVATSRMLAYQVPERLAWYRALWERRGALTALLMERLAAHAERDLPEDDPADMPAAGRSAPEYPPPIPRETAPFGSG
ncbi:MAG: methyltransferase domain-containing protein [Rhodospirillales bacterium]|nr:methyltransferase domain-containing protein [Rhodospirillales bacterium]